MKDIFILYINVNSYEHDIWQNSVENFSSVLLLLFLAVSCKQSEQHSSWEKKYDSFYRSVTDSLTTHPQQIRALAKQKDGDVD